MAAGLDLQNRLSTFATANDNEQVTDELFALGIAHVQFSSSQADHCVFHNLNSAFDRSFRRTLRTRIPAAFTAV